MTDFLDFSNFEKPNSKFSAKLATQGGHIIFSNSGQRGEKKFFTLGLESFFQSLKDIRSNISQFIGHEEYIEKDWRDLGSRYFNDAPANAQSTVQTKPFFATLSKIIMWANSPELDHLDSENEISLKIEHVNKAIQELEILIEKFTPKSVPTKKSRLELVVEKRKIRDFALFVFKYFFSKDWDKVLFESNPKDSSIDGKVFIRHDFQNFKGLIGEFSSPQTKEDLTTSNTQRFFEEPIFKKDYKHFYFSTQWVGDKANGDLSFDSLKKYFESHFHNYRLTSSANKYQLIKRSNEDEFKLLPFEKSLKEAGLFFSSILIERFVASLTTKPFVILTGLSGSGKTKLAQAFVTWICEDNNQFCIVPVGADWTNREPLLGYSNAIEQGKYVKPENDILDILLRAERDEQKPYFIILDEMNLSHVERYFADFLSIMETGEDIILFKDAATKDEIPSNVRWPKNVFIIGTVNIDETTYMFSPKVLDRANTIEFRITQDEMKEFLQANEKPDLKILEGNGANMAQVFLKISEASKFAKPDNSVNEILLLFFKELKKTGAEFGYRSATEIHQLLHNLSIINAEMKENQKMDIAIMQKLLPKIHGSRRRLVPVLETLGGFCTVNSGTKIIKDVFEKQEFDFFNSEVVKYPLSLEKISRMYHGVIENGFASYAEA